VARIVLTRHGHVAGIDPVRFRGRANLPLTETGRAQAAATSARIASEWHPSIVYTSPLDRCVETGAAIAQACAVRAAEMPELNDIDYGAWQGLTHEEARLADPDLYATWRHSPHRVRFPNGESLQDIALRTADALRRVWRDHQNAIVVLVGHESVNRVLLMQVLDQPLSLYWRLDQKPCCLNEIELLQKSTCVLRVNDHLHALTP
jgi:probable phosphoglycerate mutase